MTTHNPPMTYPMTDPQMKTKTMNMTMDKTRVQNCDVRAVSHSCDVLLGTETENTHIIGSMFIVILYEELNWKLPYISGQCSS